MTMMGSEHADLTDVRSPVEGVTPPATIPEQSSILVAPARSIAMASDTEHPTISMITSRPYPSDAVSWDCGE